MISFDIFFPLIYVTGVTLQKSHQPGDCFRYIHHICIVSRTESCMGKRDVVCRCMQYVVNIVTECAFSSGGIKLTLVVVQVCRRDFSNSPFSCIPVFGNIYIFMYEFNI